MAHLIFSHLFQQYIKQMEPNALQKTKQRVREHGVHYKIEELCLDEIRMVIMTQQISAFIESCMRLEHLSLCSCQLSSLVNLPTLNNLYTLQLSYNNLESDHLEPLMKYSKLYSLQLDNNCIRGFTWVRFFKRTRLAELCLKDNPITGEQEYREKVYKLFGADLEILDGIDRQGNAVDQASSIESESSEGQMQSGQSGDSAEQEQVESQQEVEDSLQKKIKKEGEEQQS